jgi:TRAP-type C4-dicarboxylate transport system permease small subunit
MIDRDDPLIMRLIIPVAMLACLVGLCWLGTEAMKELIAGAAHNIKK